MIKSNDTSSPNSYAKLNYTKLSTTMLSSTDNVENVNNKVIIGEEEDEPKEILDETLIRGSGLCLNMGALFAKRA